MKINKKGFTLLELLVVILIIGILAAIALPQYRKAVAKAQLTQVIMATKSVRSALQRYYLAQDQWPNSITELDIELDSNVSCGIYLSNAYCYNDKFALWRSETSLECAAKTKDENSALAYACKHFANFNNCRLSDSSSNCLYNLNLKPCFVCQRKSTL